MNELATNKAMAERELSAFVTAVTEIFGSDEAKTSADVWLRELACADLPATPREWRMLTIAAAAQLASRVNRQN